MGFLDKLLAGLTCQIDKEGTLVSVKHGLENVRIPKGVVRIGHDAFKQCQDTLQSAIIPESVNHIEDHAFSSCKRLREIKLPHSITRIEESTFSYCESLQTIEIPDSVTYIDDMAFYKCKSLREIKFPDSITHIGDSAFDDCKILQEITIPNSVRYIGTSAFGGCENLREIKIPATVTRIGVNAFKTQGFTKSPTPLTIHYEGTEDRWKEIYDSVDYSIDVFGVLNDYKPFTHSNDMGIRLEIPKVEEFCVSHGYKIPEVYFIGSCEFPDKNIVNAIADKIIAHETMFKNIHQYPRRYTTNLSYLPEYATVRFNSK